MKIPLNLRMLSSPMPLSCRMTWPLPTRDLSSAFPPFLVLLWEHDGWWFSLGQKEGEKEKKKKKQCAQWFLILHLKAVIFSKLYF